MWNDITVSFIPQDLYQRDSKFNKIAVIEINLPAENLFNDE